MIPLVNLHLEIYAGIVHRHNIRYEGVGKGEPMNDGLENFAGKLTGRNKNREEIS